MNKHNVIEFEPIALIDLKVNGEITDQILYEKYNKIYRYCLNKKAYNAAIIRYQNYEDFDTDLYMIVQNHFKETFVYDLINICEVDINFNSSNFSDLKQEFINRKIKMMQIEANYYNSWCAAYQNLLDRLEKVKK